MSSQRFSPISDRLPAFLAGASAGLLLAWLVSRSRSGPVSAPSPAPSPAGRADASRPPWRWAETWDGARDTLASARERLLGSDELDLEELRGRVKDLPGTEQLDVRDLGEGIVELVGQAPDAAEVRRALDALAEAPGVQVVVNRSWTPSSLGGGGEDRGTAEGT